MALCLIWDKCFLRSSNIPSSLVLMYLVEPYGNGAFIGQNGIFTWLNLVCQALVKFWYFELGRLGKGGREVILTSLWRTVVWWEYVVPSAPIEWLCLHWALSWYLQVFRPFHSACSLGIQHKFVFLCEDSWEKVLSNLHIEFSVLLSLLLIYQNEIIMPSCLPVVVEIYPLSTCYTEGMDRN